MLKVKISTWVQDLGTKRDGIILTDDFDSVLSFYLLKRKYPNLLVKGYYDFESLWLQDNRSDIENSVFVDCDANLEEFKCIGNHRSIDYGDNINLNTFIDSNDYKEKYPFSTALAVLYLFYSKVEIDALSESFIRLLLSVDGGYIGYFKDNGKWKKHHVEWLKSMNMTRILDVLSTSTINDFESIIDEFKLNEKITYNSSCGLFETKIDYFSLLFDYDIDLFDVFNVEYCFNFKEKYKKKYVNDYQIRDYPNLISLAETFKNKYSITYQ